MVRTSVDIGKRLIWCRKMLGIKQQDFARLCGLSNTTYNGHEHGASCRNPETFLIITKTMNNLWVKKFTKSFPCYLGVELPKITLDWVMFGETQSLDKDKQVEELKNELIKQSIYHANREAGLVLIINQLTNEILNDN